MVIGDGDSALGGELETMLGDTLLAIVDGAASWVIQAWTERPASATGTLHQIAPGPRRRHPS